MRSPPGQAVSHLEVDPRRINASRKVGAVGRNAARLMAEACGLLRRLEEAEREIPPSLMCVCSYLCDAVGHKFGEGSRSVVTGERERERSLCGRGGAGGAEKGEEVVAGGAGDAGGEGRDRVTANGGGEEEDTDTLPAPRNLFAPTGLQVEREAAASSVSSACNSDMDLPSAPTGAARMTASPENSADRERGSGEDVGGEEAPPNDSSKATVSSLSWKFAALGGVLFLRFICPAMITPENNGLCSTPPCPHDRYVRENEGRSREPQRAKESQREPKRAKREVRERERESERQSDTH